MFDFDARPLAGDVAFAIPDLASFPETGCWPAELESIWDATKDNEGSVTEPDGAEALELLHVFGGAERESAEPRLFAEVEAVLFAEASCDPLLAIPLRPFLSGKSCCSRVAWLFAVFPLPVAFLLSRFCDCRRIRSRRDWVASKLAILPRLCGAEVSIVDGSG